MSMKKLKAVRKYLFRHGRYLDIARWNYHNEQGNELEVLKALAVYQNPDGGFGHGLEPNLANPKSNPLSTSVAVKLLRELNYPRAADGMIQKILNYLSNSFDQVDGIWRALVPSNDYHLHAPWLGYQSGHNPFGYYPSAGFYGFVLRFASQDSELYQKVQESLSKMVEDVSREDYSFNPDELADILDLYRDLASLRMESFFPGTFPERLRQAVLDVVDFDQDQYGDDNDFTPPALFISQPDDFLAKDLSGLLDFYQDYLEESLTQEGYWDVNWTWGDQEIPDHVLRAYRGKLIVDNMFFNDQMYT